MLILLLSQTLQAKLEINFISHFKNEQLVIVNIVLSCELKCIHWTNLLGNSLTTNKNRTHHSQKQLHLSVICLKVKLPGASLHAFLLDLSSAPLVCAVGKGDRQVVIYTKYHVLNGKNTAVQKEMQKQKKTRNITCTHKINLNCVHFENCAATGNNVFIIVLEYSLRNTFQVYHW